MSQIRTNSISDPEVNYTLLDGEKELVGVLGSLAVIQVTPEWSGWVGDNLRCRVVATDQFTVTRKTTIFFSEEDLDTLIDMLIGVRSDIQKADPDAHP